MNWTKRLLVLGALLAGLLLMGGHAWADSGDGNASGNAVGTSAADGPATVQADVCGNSVGVIGDPQASCRGDQGASSSSGGGTAASGGGSGDGNEPPGGGTIPSSGGGTEPPSGGGGTEPSGGTVSTGGNGEAPSSSVEGGLLVSAEPLVAPGARLPELAFTGDHLRAFAFAAGVLLLLGALSLALGRVSAPEGGEGRTGQ